MKIAFKRALAFLLTVVMMSSGISSTQYVRAEESNSALMSTEEIDDPIEKTEHAVVYFSQSATKK